MFHLAQDVGSPLGNILSWRELNLLSLEDTKLLVNEPTHNHLPPEFAERIFLETGGHPALAQYLMKFVCDRDLDVAERSLNEALEFFYHYERDKFERWWEKFPPVAQQIYAQILSMGVSNDSPVSRLVLLQSFPNVNIGRALNLLCHWGVVHYDSTQDTYRAAGRMFQNWFHQFAVVQNSPDLAEQVDRLLKDLERALRNLLHKHLRQKYGPNWLHRYIAKIQTKTRDGTVSLLEAWSATAKCSPENLDSMKALLYAELSDLFLLISREWGDLKDFFQFSRDPSKNKRLLEERQECLIGVRNALRHTREETVSVTDLLKAQAFCVEMMERLRQTVS